jgi:hypothetical protein
MNIVEKGKHMDTKYKVLTVNELVNRIYEDNLNHFEYHENMGGEDCDCNLHNVMNTIMNYWGE